MAAKKMPAKKVAAKKAAPTTSAGRVRMANEKSMTKYNSSTIATLKKKAPIRSSDMSGYKSKREFQMAYADAVATGSLSERGQNEPFQKAAEKYAGAAWDKKFGKKKK